MIILGYIIICLVAFLIGSIPTGLLIGFSRGIDIRKQGSGNTGAANAFRILGKKLGMLVFFGDAFKGWFVVTLGFQYALSKLTVIDPTIESGEWLRFLLATSVVAGHVWSVFLNFDGGKGVATAVGVLFGLSPFIALAGFVWFLIVVLLTRFVSLGSILGTLMACGLSWIFGNSLTTSLFTTVILLVILVRHRENIVRLKNGTERKFSFKKNDSATHL